MTNYEHVYILMSHRNANVMKLDARNIEMLFWIRIIIFYIVPASQ